MLSQQIVLRSDWERVWDEYWEKLYHGEGYRVSWEARPSLNAMCYHQILLRCGCERVCTFKTEVRSTAFPAS